MELVEGTMWQEEHEQTIRAWLCMGVCQLQAACRVSRAHSFHQRNCYPARELPPLDRVSLQTMDIAL
jgi:hypothetical protein